MRHHSRKRTGRRILQNNNIENGLPVGVIHAIMDSVTDEEFKEYLSKHYR
jgi:hypothetical protein